MCKSRSTGRYMVAGVVSFGELCVEEGTEGVYTNVLKYIDWIEWVISKNYTHIKATELFINVPFMAISNPVSFHEYRFLSTAWGNPVNTPMLFKRNFCT